MSTLDVVVVAYNSRRHLRSCVAPLVGLPGVEIVVVDNASSDGGIETIGDLAVTTVRSPTNRGFAAGCNMGSSAGNAPLVLFLNPDATIDESSLRAMVALLDENTAIAVVAPRIERPDGGTAWSQRRFPRLRATYARALFLHRVFPRASWTDEVIRDPQAYAERSSPEWVSGACLLVRRSALEEVGGWDEEFFLYGEDIDLCRRLRDHGYELVFEPGARATHMEGASAPRSETLPMLVTSRLRYDRKHRGHVACVVDRVGIALGALTHVVVSRGGGSMRAGHVRALGVALRPRMEDR